MLNGKPNKYQLTADEGDDQEGAAVPIALLDTSGNRITGVTPTYLGRFDFDGTNTPTLTDIINNTGETASTNRPAVGEYTLNFTDDVLGNNAIINTTLYKSGSFTDMFLTQVESQSAVFFFSADFSGTAVDRASGDNATVAIYII